MNFLAHFYLSRQNENLILGNFVADFINTKEVKRLPAFIVEGVHFHRKIDFFTDNHPVFHNGTKRLHPNHHKYSPVILDVFYDHLLIKNWKKYSSIPLEDFTGIVYEILNAGEKYLPAEIRNVLPQMVEDNWLLFSKNAKGLNKIFNRLKMRISRPENLDNVVKNLCRDIELYDKEFNEFFPELIQESEKWF